MRLSVASTGGGAGSRSAGMKIQAWNPLRAACAATALARFPVDEQATVSKPKFRAWASATATTRSLKLNVGRQMADKPPATETTAPQPALAGEKSIGEDANVGIILSLMESANQPEAAVRP